MVTPGAETDNVPSNQGPMQQVSSNCKRCNRPDNVEDMVACDKCNSWWHFSCAGVTGSIAERSWKCDHCSTFCGSVTSGQTSMSAQLRLKQLEEKKALEDKLQEDKAQREREFLIQKHQLEAEAEAEKEGGSLRSFGSHHSQNDVRNWVTKQNFVDGKTNPAATSTSTPIDTSTYATSVLPKVIYTATHPLAGNAAFASQPVYTFAPALERRPMMNQSMPPPQHPPSTPYGLPKPMLPPVRCSEVTESSIPVFSQSYVPKLQSVPHMNAIVTGIAPDRRISECYTRAGPSFEICSTVPTSMINQNSSTHYHVTQPTLAFPHTSHPILPSDRQFIPPITRSSDIMGPSLAHSSQPNSQQQHPVIYRSAIETGVLPKAKLQPEGPYPQYSTSGINYELHQPMLPPNASIQYPLPTMTHLPVPQSAWPSDGIISPQQLAARHVVSRDLPKFAGDPLEWPMFLSSFESTTAMCGIQPDENLARLQRSLVGSAREKVQSILTLPSAIPEIMNTLRDECGRPEQLVYCLLSRIRSAPPPNVNKLETLVTFGREVKNLVTYIEAASLHTHLSNPMLLTELVGKLPPSLRLDWGLYSQRISEVSLKAFSDFTSSIKAAACQVSFPADAVQLDYSSRRVTKKEKDGFVNAHSADDENRPELEPEFRISGTSRDNDSSTKPCHLCQRIDHRIRNCGKFKKLTHQERLEFVEKKKLCKRCLTGHGNWPCRTKQPCGVDDCKELHHKLLHTVKPIASSAENITRSDPSATVFTHRQHKKTSLFKILPVILHNKGKSVNTFAFLDDGSDLTLMEKGIANELGLGGIESPLCLQWTGHVTRNESSSKKVQLTISGVNDKSEYLLHNVRTVENLGLPRQSLDYNNIAKQFPFLRDLPIQSYSNALPGILIGVDNARLKLPIKKRDRRDREPVAIKTRLGWTIFGGRRESSGSVGTMFHVCDCSDDQKLHDLVKDYFATDDAGICRPVAVESVEDQRAREILQRTTKRTSSGRFETGLLWKTDEVVFPNSYPMAERRLHCLERRLRAEPELRILVCEQIDEYLERGYAHKATMNELYETNSGKVWYLPLGVVRNPRKPNRIRVVWDAAATVTGISLNSTLLKGPDLLTPLLSVLCRFRQRKFAIAGDIRQMFHQVLIREEDRQSQRFLWRSDTTSPPSIYIMDVATFGATCSPCSAQYVKNANAMEFAERFPEAASAIISNTYVDDYLDSRDTIEELISLACDVRTVHSKAGFEIRNWQSNSDQVLTRVGEKASDTIKTFSAEKTAGAERILGMMWIPNEDVFVFAAQFRADLRPLLTGDIIPTKRQVLQVVMSLFDPLGIIATHTIHGKILIQDVWRSGIEWDDPIKDPEFNNWQRWVKLTPELDRVKIPRCYFPNYEPNDYKSLQIHVFVDASELAYCCVAYFRIVKGDGSACCSLVASKAKVTPLRPQTIPKNELNAAVMGVRLTKTIADAHDLQIQKRFIWTDSTTVLSWLRADPRKYRPYVAFRVAEILNETTLEEWNWVPTRMNIADEATKWNGGPSFDPHSSWFCGPDFLRQPESQWPRNKLNLQEPIEELRSINVHRECLSETIVTFSNFSRLQDLLKRLAYIHHFINRCRLHGRKTVQTRNVVLCQEDYAAAERSLWFMVQAEAYSEEISVLKFNAKQPIHQHKRFRNSSPLKGLSPFIDDDNIIRMESRIDPKAAYYCFGFRNPVILPRQSYVTELLILRFHQRYGHANKETVLNEMKQRFYVSKLRSLIGKVVKKCMWCRVYRAKPSAPRMASLPEVRVCPYVRPFTFTGVDYFGPLVVKRGRTNVKRWVALFTCLTVRAIHLEVVHSLSAEACKMAIRRFVARRGAPQQMFSDNGTNFRGSARELAEEIKTINRELANTFTNAETAWHFNPPSAPHMGGVWERKVRSVKEALKVLSHREKLDDEGLITLLTEAEMIVNSHPLTFVPLENPDQEVITPNSFILMNSTGSNDSDRISIDQPISLRTNWKLLQHLLNQFWKRWIQAYLPTIARRTKWFTDTKPLRVGDLVIVVDESVRNGWLRGRVIKAYQGPDNQVRKVDVQTSVGILQRPAIKVALLDVLEDSKASQG